ncbi:MAG: TIM barrel protein [Victivallales bacterium]
MFGFSTNWFPENTTQTELTDFIEKSGLNSFELSYRATPQFIEIIADLVSQELIKVRSVHDVCPRPVGYKCESPAALCEEERRKAVELTKQRTIKMAEKVKADCIVLHLGQVEMQKSTREMVRVFSSEPREKFEQYRREFIAERRAKAPAHFAQARKSLQELSGTAGDCGIKLAVENRFWYEEFPDFAEIGILLNEFPPDKISYWHDTSHAQAMENLGFCTQRAYLDAYGDRLAGFHISDMSFKQDISAEWLNDYVDFKTEHKAPGCGNINFSFLKDFRGRNDIRLIFEFYKMVTLPQISAGITYLEKILY